MAGVMPDTRQGDENGFRLEAGVLHCPYDLNSLPPKELRIWCEKLLASPHRSLAVDLSGTRHIASHHLGIIAQAWSEALAAGRELVVRISPSLRRVFEVSGFDQVFMLIEQ